MVTVGVPTNSSQDGILDFDWRENPSINTIIITGIANPADNNGGITQPSVRIKNTSGLTVTGRFHVFGLFYDGSTARVTLRSSASSSFVIANGFDGVKSPVISAMEIHQGDVIAIQLSKTGTASGATSIYTTDGVSNAKWYSLLELPTQPTVIELANGAPMIYGSGPNYSVGTGIGGEPRNLCHSVNETVNKNNTSQGLWGRVTPRDFGVSGGVSSAYIDLTFPWSNAGVYAEDEVFQSGVTRSFINSNNPMEHYTLKMDVFRYTESFPDAKILDNSFEDGGVWVSSVTSHAATARSGVSGITPDGALVGSFTLGPNFVSGNYAAYTQSNVEVVLSCTVEFRWRWGCSTLSPPSGQSVAEILVDGSVVWSANLPSGTINTWQDGSFTISSGTRTIVIRQRATGSGSHTMYFYADFLNATTTHNETTGRCYNFYECWWVESSNGDVWVDGIDGSDYNLGTEGAPFKTLEKGYAEVETGGTINVKCQSTVYPTSSYALPYKSCAIKPIPTVTGIVTNEGYLNYTNASMGDTQKSLFIYPSKKVPKAGIATKWRISCDKACLGRDYMLLILRETPGGFTVVGHSDWTSIVKVADVNSYYAVGQWSSGLNFAVQANDCIGMLCSPETPAAGGLNGFGATNHQGTTLPVYAKYGDDAETYVNSGSMLKANMDYWSTFTYHPCIEVSVGDSSGFANQIKIIPSTTVPAEEEPEDPYEPPDEPDESEYFTIGLSGSGADYICGTSATQVQINQAIAAAQATNDKRHIRFISPGTYWISEPIGHPTITINNLEISAVSGVVIKLQAGLSWAKMVSMIDAGNDETNKSNIIIHGFEVNGNYDAYSSVTNGTDYYTNIYVKYCNGLDVYDMRLVASKNDSLRLSRVDYLNFYNNYCHNGHDGVNGYYVNNSHFYHNEFYCRTNCGVRIYNGHDCLIENNKCYATGSCGVGIQLQSAAYNITIRNNTIHNMLWGGIWITQHGGNTTSSNANVEIYDNLIYDCGDIQNAYSAGISLNGFNANIHHNIIDGCYDYGLRITKGYYDPINTGWVMDTDYNIISNIESPSYAGHNSLTSSHTLNIHNSWLYNNAGGTVNCVTGNNSTADPLFVNRANKNFNLQTSSPAKSAFAGHIVGCNW